MSKSITVQTTIKSPINKVWSYWNEPTHIMNWAFASADWHAPDAKNDLKVGGKFSTTMAAKDGSASFEFEGVYDIVELNKQISYTMADGRKVSIQFEDLGDDTVKVTETFDMENQNSEEMQRVGWQAILENFRKYVEQI